MAAENVPEAQPRVWRRRLLYYAVAALVVTVSMKIGSPEKLCAIADGVTESVTRVDAFYVLKQVHAEYQKENRRFLNYAADYGGVQSTNPYSSGIGLLLTSIWRGLKNTVAADWATLLISLLALLLSVVILYRLKSGETHPIYYLLAIPLSGLIAFVLKYVLLVVSYPLGCGGQFWVAVMAVWPVVKFGLDMKDWAGKVEGAAGRLKK